MKHIPWAKPTYWGNEYQYLNDAMKTTWISGGNFVDRFETDFAQYTGTPNVISTSNGTTAIHLIFLALGLGAGDEIIVPGFGFMAAANIALHVGAKPVFVEVDPDTWCMSAAGIEKCLSPLTKVIVPIHTYGNVCDMDEINRLANDHNIIVVEDAAESFLSRYKGRMSGTIGHAGCYSFQATKTITTGEGGMVVTKDKDLFDKMQLYRNHGMLKKRYWHEVPGHNFRLTNLQAALGCAQLEQCNKIIIERKRIHATYLSHLNQAPGLTVQKFPPEVEPVLWAMAVKLDPKSYPQGRDRVMEQMLSENIETRPGFYAASLMNIYSCSKLPICEEISQNIISLPTYPTLQDNQIEYICDTIKRLTN